MEGSLGRVGRYSRGSRAASFASKTPIRHVDLGLIGTALALTAFGNLMVFSASAERLEADGLGRRLFLDRQMIFSVGGFVAMVIVAAFSYRRLKAWGPIAYVGGLGMLIAVLSPLGDNAKGAQRWINIGFMQFQPSEFMKIAVIAVLALYLSERKGTPSAMDAVRASLLVVPAALLIFIQPDLGTLLVFVAVLLAVLVVGGTRARTLLLFAMLGAICTVGLLQVGVLKEYQVARLTAFLDPAADTAGIGYNLDQARTAVGSGRLTGKGLFQGSQTNLDFVPEVHTDFIFTAVGEELGFIGSLALLAMFALFLWRGFRIAALAKDLFGTLLATGIVAMFAFQIFINIGMTIGVSPITGIPLPFVSHGGSSLISLAIGLGIVQSINIRQTRAEW